MTVAAIIWPEPRFVSFTQTRPLAMTPVEIVELVSGIFARIEPAVRPLALDLLLGCTATGFPYPDHERLPPAPNWHLRRARAPLDMTIDTSVPLPVQARSAEELDRVAVADWLTCAASQHVPDRAVALYILRMTFSQVRLYSLEPTPNGTLVIQDGPDEIEAPLELRGDGHWLGAPSPVLDEPVIGMELYQGGEILHLRFTVSLSPWITPGVQEYEVFRRCLSSLLDSWELSAPDSLYGLGNP